jgi:hypothetical protein
MDLTITTPALLFPAISLLLLAFTNRFIVIANLLRTLKAQYQEHPNTNILSQLSNLKRRISLIRYMQAFGIASFFFCVFAMFLLFFQQIPAAKFVFGSSLILLMVSLYLSFREIHISGNALNIELSDLQKLMEENESRERELKKAH